ncbi:MAG: ABC1 kinase family protein, partial [Phycisphaerae bacterium]
DDPDVLVPRVRWDLTGLDVLTVQRLAGRKLEEVLACDDGAVDRPAAAANLVRAFLKQYFELGMFHADPHPGNLLIAPPARLVMLDFGMVGQVDEEMATQLAIGLTAAVTQEVDILIDVLADLGALGPQTRRSQLRRDLRALLGKYYALPLKRLDPQGIFAALNDVIRQHDVQLPRDFVLLGKSLVTVGGVALQLDPELNLVELVRPRIRKMVAERLSPPRLLRLAGISSWHLLSIFKNAPRQLRDFLRRLGGGQMQINIRHENLDYLASELDRSSNRLAISVVIGATIVGSSMLVSMESGAQVLVLGLVSLRTFGFVGYFAAFVMGAWLVYAVWRSGKLS